jgi:hypothetical protein
MGESIVDCHPEALSTAVTVVREALGRPFLRQAQDQAQGLRVATCSARIEISNSFVDIVL